MDSPLVLASASPRRRELLARLGVTFRALAPAVDETPRAGEGAEALAARLAEAKARRTDAGATTLAADTVVAVDDQVLGKPRGASEADAMLAQLSGREHRVVTALALRHQGGFKRAIVVTRVWFRTLGEAERRVYAGGAEALGAAGAYAIQGGGGAFAVRLVGSYSNVVGLPLAETARLLRAAGFGP